LLLSFKTSDDPTMSDHRIMIGRSLCRNFAHHCLAVPATPLSFDQAESMIPLIPGMAAVFPVT
jgi:hypothetical protein